MEQKAILERQKIGLLLFQRSSSGRRRSVSAETS
ncbi:hypothetical protein Nmel_014141 [Mimus melanotis]